MPSQKLVRCQVGRPGRTESTVRYVPLAVFGLWKYLMEHKHGLEVRSSLTSIWVELDGGDGTAVEESRAERVTGLQLFVRSDPDSLLNEVSRFVPSSEIAEVRPILDRHYASGQAADSEASWRERPGIWFRPVEDGKSG